MNLRSQIQQDVFDFKMQMIKLERQLSALPTADTSDLEVRLSNLKGQSEYARVVLDRITEAGTC